MPSELAAVRESLAKYEDPIVAIHDGYFSTLGCIEFKEAGGEGRMPYQPGGMGIHFLNVAAIGPVPDPARPQILLYEPTAEGLKLVAAEWFIPLSTGVRGRPEIFGQAFDGPMAGHHPLMPEALHHYDLHVWLFKPNPLGTFEPTNPDVRCDGYSHISAEAAPLMVTHEGASGE